MYLIQAFEVVSSCSKKTAKVCVPCKKKCTRVCAGRAGYWSDKSCQLFPSSPPRQLACTQLATPQHTTPHHTLTTFTISTSSSDWTPTAPPSISLTQGDPHPEPSEKSAFLSQYCKGIGHSRALSFLMLPKKYISETDRTMPCQSSPIACRSSLEEARYIACRPCPPPRPSKLMRNGCGITLPNIFLAGKIFRVTP